MIGLVEDLETDVMVTGGVGVFIEELRITLVS